MRLRAIPATIAATLLALQVLGLPSTGQTQADGPAAVLMQCKGSVTVTRAQGGRESGAFGLQLLAGDRVGTGADGSAEIMLEDGTWVQIGPGSGMQIRARTAQAAESTPTPAQEKQFQVVQNFVKLRSAEGTSALTGLRGGDGDALAGVAPGRTRIRADRPTFQWKIADPSEEVKVTVYSASGAIWETTVSAATSVAYPADAPALAPGARYSWTAETTDPLRVPPLRSQALFFEIISPEEADMLSEALEAIDSQEKPGKSTYHLMRASLFFDSGLVDDAINETLTALVDDPENDALHAILARLYAETGRTTDAVATLDRLVGDSR